MKKEPYKKLREKNKKLANGKSSKDCTLDEAINIYKAGIPKEETMAERMERINAFRCGW